MKWKRAVVRTFFSKFRRIVTSDRLEHELKELGDTFLENGYPERFIDKYSNQSAKREPLILAPKTIYIELLFKGGDVTALIK